MLILASQSPRRRELLSMLGYEFLCCPADDDEIIPEEMEPGRAVELLAERKAAAAAAGHPDAVVVGSDTVVVLDSRILGKPTDQQDAARMLRALSDRTHRVYTGVAVLAGPGRRIFHNVADVTFYPLSEEEIAGYVATGEPMDKAGAYGIQGKGAVLVREIRGDFYTVMGLPVAALSRTLADFSVFPAK